MPTTIDFQPKQSPLISTDTGVPVGFSLINNGAQTLRLYWIDREGVQQLYHEIRPGQTILQATLSTHPWLLESDDGAFATKFLPAASGLITIAPDFTPAFMDYGEKFIRTDDGLWSTSQGYGLIDAAGSLGVADTVELPVGGENNHLALNAINAPSAWAAGFTGKGVKVAVIDAGIADSPELDGKIVAGHDFYDKDTTPQPDEGPYKDHALGVAAIIAASHAPHSGRDTLGVAPDASLINVRVGSSIHGSNPVQIAEGIRYAVDQGAKVLCIPLQSPGTQSDPLVAEAVRYAYQHDVVTVIIGGNYSNYGPTGPALVESELGGQAIIVGNFNVMAGTLFGSSNMAGGVPGNWVVAGSSGWVPDSRGGYVYHEDGGTSFAGPYVAGLAALLWQQDPDASAAEIMARIVKGAEIAGQPLPPQEGVSASDADQVFHALPGTTLDAGGGLDTVVFAGRKEDYAVSAVGDGFKVVNLADKAANLLIGVERLAFSDAALALDVGDGNGGDVYRLYQAAFNRAPDLPGLGFWIDAMDKGALLREVAASFVGSGEFLKLYGAEPTDLQLVTTMYRNILHRAPDQGGLDYWVGRMEDGMDKASLLASLSDSAENRLALAAIIGDGFEYVPYV